LIWREILPTPPLKWAYNEFLGGKKGVFPKRLGKTGTLVQRQQREALVLKVKEASIKKKGLLTEQEFKKIFDQVAHG
jgi:hypothetical protein